jgi:hypothetical protein
MISVLVDSISQNKRFNKTIDIWPTLNRESIRTWLSFRLVWMSPLRVGSLLGLLWFRWVAAFSGGFGASAVSSESGRGYTRVASLKKQCQGPSSCVRRLLLLCPTEAISTASAHKRAAPCEVTSILDAPNASLVGRFIALNFPKVSGFGGYDILQYSESFGFWMI